jgi:hypothetical protein
MTLLLKHLANQENILGRLKKTITHALEENKRHKTDAAKQSALPSDRFILA